MSTYNSTYRYFISGDRIIPERLNFLNKGVRNHVLTGFTPASAGGLTLEVGVAGTNIAYINGFEVYSGSALTTTLSGGITYNIYLAFTYTVDTLSGTYSTITPVLEALYTTQSPVNDDYLLIAQVTTDATQITDVTPEWGSFFYMPPAAFAREHFPIASWLLPGSNYPTIDQDTSSGTRTFEFKQAEFADGASAITFYYPWQVPWNFSGDQPEGFPRLRVQWKANSTNTALKARLEAAVAAYTPATDAGSFDAKSLSVWAGQSASQLGTTAYRLNQTLIDIENTDSLVAGDMAVIGFRRDPTHSDDDLNVDVEVVSISIEYQVGD